MDELVVRVSKELRDYTYKEYSQAWAEKFGDAQSGWAYYFQYGRRMETAIVKVGNEIEFEKLKAELEVCCLMDDLASALPIELRLLI